MPVQSWIDLYGAVASRYWQDKSVMIGSMHPAKPRETQRKFLRAASEAWGTGKKEFWQTASGMKRWLRGVKGVVIRDKEQERDGGTDGR